MGARFVRLGIAGFKSFADSVSLEILPGLTGVVGPNGCGKSNVAEALRWGMGEANARHLRGGEMDDVIFAGTSNRPSRNVAEVSLHMEGDMTGLPPPFATQAELQVVRRIQRGGGSAYRVNGREVRARDVQTLFADLASGARASAMVSQGRVGALVNARPEERRAVLEEAAGITGLHARRAEAETRLRAAETNLERAEERRVLLERQLAGLHGQAKQAARYRTVMDAMLEAEVALLGVQRARADAARVHAERAVGEAEDAISAAAATAHAAMEAAVAAQAGLPAARGRESDARHALDRARLAQEGIAADSARADAALSEAKHRRDQLVRDLAHAQASLDEAEGADARLVAEAERLSLEIEAFPAGLEAAREEAAAAALALQAADQAAGDLAAAAAEATARAKAVQQMLEHAEARARRAREAEARLLAERSRIVTAEPSRVEGAAAAREAAQRTLLTTRLDQDRAEVERSRTSQVAASARDLQARVDAVRLRLAAETGALAEILAVKDGERWPPMVDRLIVPSGLEAALGAALGEDLAAADNPAAARHWRPLPALRGADLPGRRLNELVQAPPLLDRALACIGLVESDADGDAGQGTLQPGQSLVSAEGAVWRWDGYTVRRGTPTTAAVRLQQRNRLAALRVQLANAEQEVHTARGERVAAEAAERSAVSAEHEARVARRAAEAAAERAGSAAQAILAQAQAAAQRLAALEEQTAALAPELSAATESLETARRERVAGSDPAALRDAAHAARGEVAAARTREATAARALDGLERTEQARQTRIVTIGRERDDRRMRAADLRGRVIDLQARLEEATTDLECLAGAPADIARRAEQARSMLDAAAMTLRNVSLDRESAERAAEHAASAARSAEHATFATRESLVRAEGLREAAGQGSAAIAARIEDRQAALPPIPVPSEFSAVVEDRARNRLQRLTRERDEMGPVNLRAEMEAQTIETDIGVIAREREELGTAIAKLRGSIGHLNREGRERLAVIFQEVDRHFQTLFGRMFGGGRAHLALVGSDDPLQAGLEIYAQPPGKKLTSLSLLSGGEQALTALSLIFAVFRCNPAPLCVLDEVDAPLDDANVERFCGLLADMVQETGTRFLVVTHHQVTMSRMDRLYGVTMQERGVSRLLSVDLSHATGMVDAVAAE